MKLHIQFEKLTRKSFQKQVITGYVSNNNYIQYVHHKFQNVVVKRFFVIVKIESTYMYGKAGKLHANPKRPCPTDNVQFIFRRRQKKNLLELSRKEQQKVHVYSHRLQFAICHVSIPISFLSISLSLSICLPLCVQHCCCSISDSIYVFCLNLRFLLQIWTLLLYGYIDATNTSSRL